MKQFAKHRPRLNGAHPLSKNLMFRWHADISGNIVQEDYSPFWKSAINFSAESQQTTRLFDPKLGLSGTIGTQETQFIDMTYYWVSPVYGLTVWLAGELGDGSSGMATTIDSALADWSPATNISIDFFPTYFGSGYDQVIDDGGDPYLLHNFYQKIEGMSNSWAAHTMCATLSTTDSKLYLDGVLVGTVAAGPFYDFANYFRFNAASPIGNAIMSGAAGWGRVLNADEIAELHYDNHAGLLMPRSLNLKRLAGATYAAPAGMWLH